MEPISMKPVKVYSLLLKWDVKPQVILSFVRLVWTVFHFHLLWNVRLKSTFKPNVQRFSKLEQCVWEQPSFPFATGPSLCTFRVLISRWDGSRPGLGGCISFLWCAGVLHLALIMCDSALTAGEQKENRTAWVCAYH